MKKFLCMVLAAMLLLCGTVALAEEPTVTPEGLTKEEINGSDVDLGETAPNFDVTMVVPDGYTMTKYTWENTIFLSIDSADETTPDYVVTIAFSEEYDGQTLNDMTDSEKEPLLASETEGFFKADVQDAITEFGTHVYIINEVGENCENYYATAFTIYKGYFIHAFAVKPNLKPLSDDDLHTTLKLISDMQFVDK